MNEDQMEAADHLREAMRIFNEAVRRAVKEGLVVDVGHVMAHHPSGKMPWVDVSANLPS